MNRYYIRIDGEQSAGTFTYQELVDMGLFELDSNSLDGIEVKEITTPNFSPLILYCFPELQTIESSDCIDEYGQIHRNTSNQNSGHNGAYVDEFGQIIRPNSSGSSLSNTSNSTNSSSNSPSSSGSGYSSSSDGWTTFWRIIGTIMVIGLVIAISVGTSGFGIPIIGGGYLALKAIWNDN